MRNKALADADKLRERLRQRVNVYAASASAACAGVLTAAPSALGQVVYTPAHVVIGPGSSYNLDVDHNGITDFQFNDHFFSELAGSLVVSAFSFNAVEVKSSLFLPVALKRGSRIGSSQRFWRQGTSFFSYELMASVQQSAERGNFTNVKDRYLGLEFFIKNEVHYGWARFTVQVNPDDFKVNALLSGCAYEATPEKPIRAGQTSGTVGDPFFDRGPEDSEDNAEMRPEQEPISQAVQETPLGILALGAQGISFWRPTRTRRWL